MKNEVYPEKYTTNSECKREVCAGPVDPDPLLSNIRLAIELNAPQSTEERTENTQLKEGAPKLKKQVQAIRQFVPKTLPARWLFERVTSFFKRPNAPRILSVLLLLAFLALKPGFVLFLLLITVLIGLVLYFSVGPERAQDWAYNRYRRLSERDPDGARRIRQRAAVASKKLSEIIEKLPERWTMGLYLPDFEEPDKLPEKFRTDPFERLAKQRKQVPGSR